jgi:GlpG protein
MRQAGTLSTEQAAQRLTDYLTTLDIVAFAEREGDEWVIWVRDENQLEQAKEDLASFAHNPEDARYREATRKANSIRRDQEKKARQAARNVVDVRDHWNRPLWQRAPVVAATMALCIGATIFTWFGEANFAFAQKLFYCTVILKSGGGASVSTDPFDLIRQGEVWRLVTPVFMHGGPLHLIFNMFMFHYFGRQIEERNGAWRFLLLMLLAAVVSNTAQAMFVSGWFVGISGVVYGLFGYVWMRSRLEYDSGFSVSQLTVMILMGWLIAGVLGVLGSQIANLAHGVGLAVGLVLGALPSWLGSLKRR